MRAQIISENLEFTRGQDSKKAIGLGILRDIIKPKNLKLPVKYFYGQIVDADENTIILAERDNNESPLRPFERDDLLKNIAKLLNWAWGSSEQVQESYEFKRGKGSKSALSLGLLHDLPQELALDFPFKYKEETGDTTVILDADYNSLISAWNPDFEGSYDEQRKLFKAIVLLLNIYYSNGVLKESLNFERGIGSKKSLDVGQSYINDKIFDNIPEELLDDWRDTNYPERGIITDWNKNLSVFTVYRIPFSTFSSSELEGYEIGEFTIDELISELEAFDQGLNYKYNPNTYQWDKL